MIAKTSKIMLLFAATLVSAGGFCCSWPWKKKQVKHDNATKNNFVVSISPQKKRFKRIRKMRRTAQNHINSRDAQITDEDRMNFIVAAAEGVDKEMNKLLEKGVRVNEVHNVDEENWTALHFAVVNERESAVNVLLENGADVNAKNTKGMNAIHLNALIGNIEIMKSLLKSRAANVNEKDSKSSTPLMYANSKGHKIIAKMIVENGAQKKDFKIHNNNGLWIVGKSGESCTKACWNNRLVCKPSDFRTELRYFTKANSKHQDGMEKQLANMKGMEMATCKKELRCNSTSNYCPAVADPEAVEGERDMVEDMLEVEDEFEMFEDEPDVSKIQDEIGDELDVVEDKPIELMCLKRAAVEDHSAAQCFAKPPQGQHRMCYCSY